MTLTVASPNSNISPPDRASDTTGNLIIISTKVTSEENLNHLLCHSVGYLLRFYSEEELKSTLEKFEMKNIVQYIV